MTHSSRWLQAVVSAAVVTVIIGCGGETGRETTAEPEARMTAAEEQAPQLGPAVTTPRTPILIQSGSAQITLDRELQCSNGRCPLSAQGGEALVDVHPGGDQDVIHDPGQPGDRTLELWFRAGGPPNKGGQERVADLVVRAMEAQPWTLEYAASITCHNGPKTGVRWKHPCSGKGESGIGYYRITGGGVETVPSARKVAFTIIPMQ